MTNRNPFNPATTIRYLIPENAEMVILKVYDILGNEVAALVNESKPAGMYEAEFNAQNDISSGIYYYRLSAGNFFDVKKMTVFK